MKGKADNNFDEDKWKDYRDRIDKSLWRYIDENGNYINTKFEHSHLYPYISKYRFDWKRCTLPKEVNHMSRYKTITIDYELATLHTEDKLLEFLSSDSPFEDIKVLTIHSGYARNPLKNEDEEEGPEDECSK